MRLYLLGEYTARIQLFKFFYMFILGFLIWNFYLVYKYSGSLSRRNRKNIALIRLIISAIILFSMSVYWFMLFLEQQRHQ